MLIDTHCHLLSTEYNNLEDVIKDTNDKVDKIIINGYDLKSSIEAVKLAKENEKFYAAVGITWENIDNLDNDDIAKIDVLASSEKVVAIGEIGLDYYWTKENKKAQIDLFKKMLNIALKKHLPVIIHSREALEDTYNILKEYQLKGSIHCFSGSFEMAQKFIKLGYKIGVGGVVTFKNSKKLKEIVKNIDLSSILLETDSPYLTPEPNRGKVNMPSNVIFVADAISSIKGIDKQDVVRVTGCNAESVFDL
jgi:TatD DNase family protein